MWKKNAKSHLTIRILFVAIRILSLEPSYSFPTPFRMVSKADFIGLFAAVTEILNTGCLIVLGKIIVHAYIRAKEMWFVKRQ